MNDRHRRFLLIAIALIAALLAGRWLVSFLTTWWWAGQVSEAARATTSRWYLLNSFFTANAILLASAWFTLQTWIAFKIVASVQVQHDIGGLLIREAVPKRLLLFGSAGIGLLFGVVMDGGGDWLGRAALWASGVDYAATDPLLGIDLGWLVGNYPFWSELFAYTSYLAIGGTFFAVLVYSGIGGVRWGKPRVIVHPFAKRHIGFLFALVAAMVCINFLTNQFQFAISESPPTNVGAQIVVSYVFAGVALSVVVLSLGWAFGRRANPMIAGWLILLFAPMGGSLVWALVTPDSPDSGLESEVIRRMEGLFWGISIAEDNRDEEHSNRYPAVWAASSFENDVREVASAAQTVIAGEPFWMVVRQDSSGRLRKVSIFRGATASATGRPIAESGLFQQSLEGSPFIPGGNVLAKTQTGISAGGVLKRGAIAWALQQPRVLSFDSAERIDWNLDPEMRVAKLVPPLSWKNSGPAIVSGRLYWVVNGFATLEHAAASRRLNWDGSEIAGAVPAMIGLVDANSGATRIYLDPGADSLGMAWGRVFNRLVEPAEALPEEALNRLRYSSQWFTAQLDVISGSAWSLGQPATTGGDEGLPIGPAEAWTREGVALQSTREDPELGQPLLVLTAERSQGIPRIRVQRIDAASGPSDAQVLRHASGNPEFQRLNDSLEAVGDRLVAGSVLRYWDGTELLTWLPWRSEGSTSAVKLLWVDGASGSRLSSSRHLAELWASMQLDSLTTQPPVADATIRLEAIRAWMARGDSALARGDITAFGRAWEALRGLLVESP